MSHKYKSIVIVTLFSSVTLSGCNLFGGDSGGSLSSFNLSDISASSDDIKTMTLTWTSAFDGSGVTYAVCAKDTSQDNDCLELATVTDALTTTVTVDSLVSALTTDYFILAKEGSDVVSSNEVNITTDTVTQMIGYVKASNTEAGDQFGYMNAIALSADGSILAVGARQEDNGATGVITDGSETTDTSTETDSGAVYLYSNASGSWAQIAYVKASNTEDSDTFGNSVALSSDGSTLAVGADGEDNGATGVITDGSEILGDTSTASASGAVYLY